MPAAVIQNFQNYNGTALATFGQNGTYSTAVDLSGGHLIGLYSDNWPSAAGSVTFRAAYTPGGTGWPVQTCDGTALRVLNFGSGTFYTLGGDPPWITYALQYVTLQVGTAGTAGVAAGGTIVLIAES